MTGQRIGYVRVSTTDQNPERQLAGVETDKVFIDRKSGKDRERPELQAMLNHVREGDTVIVHSMDRLARSLVDLRQLVTEMTDRGVTVQFLSNNLVFTGADSPTSVLMLNMLGAVAEFERSLIKERQLEGIAIAKAAGKYRGRKQKLSAGKAAQMAQEHREGVGVAELARRYEISRQSVYSYLERA